MTKSSVEHLCKIALNEEVLRIEEFLRIKHPEEKKFLTGYEKGDRFNLQAGNHHNYSSSKKRAQDCEDALKRIENQEFGICVDCKEKISEERLIILPYVKRCVSCQRQHEKK